MQASALGFETITKPIALKTGNMNLGTITLSENILELADIDVVADRIKASSATGSTTFFISSKMKVASNSGTDILKLIPGVQVDLQQNISLQGSRKHHHHGRRERTGPELSQPAFG